MPNTCQCVTNEFGYSTYMITSTNSDDILGLELEYSDSGFGLAMTFDAFDPSKVTLTGSSNGSNFYAGTYVAE